ncbi:platelet formation protein family, partial [Trichomonas vaginalis G3]|uniref:platelet formation protein family n=1 Tax=Trichomonas vaginalis (strain ATCC PRA-98 / G3) TaxID=412133 RepID=UPI0021E52D12
MFSSLESIIQKIEGADLMEVWVKYFTDSSPFPKDFFTIFPSLADVHGFFGSFKEFETKAIKKAISNITDKNQLFEILAVKFKLADPINPEAFKVFSRINNLPTTKNAKKSIIYLFEYCIRTLIQFTYQLPSILTIVIEDNKPVPESLVCLHKIVFFFSLFESEYFLDFHLVLRGLLSHLSFRFDQIITNSNLAVQDACLTLMGSLVSVSRVYVSIKPETESLCVKFITEQLEKIQVLISANVMSKSLAITIRSTISSLVPGMVNLIPSQRKQLGELAITLIAPILHLNSIDSTEKYQTGIICLKLFHEYCKFDSVNLPKYLFTSLIEFINWLIVSSDIGILEENYNLPEKIPEPETLGKLSREDYFAEDNTLKEGKSIILTKRLSVVADIIVSIITHFKDPSPFVSNLINSIKEQEELIEPALYRPYVAFVLYLLMKIHESIVVEAIKDNWQLLLSEKLFPYDTTIKSDTNLQYAVMILSYRAFINSPDSRQTILSCLSRYFETNAEAGVTYFWRYLNMMLIVAKSTHFIPNIANSKLIHKIVLLSATNLGVFNFLRTCIFIKPAPLLMRQDVLDFMIENCEREKYIDSIASLYMIGFSLLDEGQSSWQVVSALMKSTSKRLASLENVKVSLSIVDFAFGKVQSWSPKLVDSIACKRFCEAVASIPVNHFSVDNYIRVLKSFTNVSRMNPSMFFLITQPDITIYDKLKIFPKDVKDENIENIIKSLFEFSFSSRTTKSNGHYIRNYKVIEIITEWVRGTNFESYVFKEFNRLAMKSIGNIFQLNRAHIPEYILERLEDIGDNISVISDLLSLFTQLCMYVFTTAILYSGIRLMRSKKFHYPNLILSTFFRLLTDEQLQGPTSFFHFDGTATGIFDAEVVINDKDCLYMSLRIDQNFDSPIQPILSITNDVGENLILSLQQNRLQASMLFQKGTTKQEGSCFIEHNTWFSIAIVFTQKVITVYYNNNQDLTLLPMSLFKKNKIFIGTMIDSMQSNGMIGDVGPVVIIKNGDPNKLSMKLSANDITDKYGNDVTLKITSRTTLQNTVLNVSELSQSVNFRGQAIPNVSTIVDSFIAVSSIPNLLPLIQRLRYCDNCKGFHSDYCNLCGGLASEHGSEMLITLLQVIIRLLQKFPSLLSTFKSIKGEKLICGFLQNINQSYLDDRSLNTLADLYKVSKDPEFSQQLIEELYLSVDFIKTLPQDMQEYYFKTVLINIWNYNKVPFQSFPSLDFMICRAMNLTTFDVYCYNHMWSFILKMVTTNLAPVFTTTIISIISKISDRKILSPLLDLFLGLIDDTMTQSCSNTLAIFDYYLPFVYCLQIPDSKIQNKILHIIARLRVSNSKLEQYMYIAALTQVKSEDPVLFVETLNSMMFWNNCPEMLPLFIKSMKEVPIDKSMEIYIDFVTLIKSQTNPEKSIIRLANWYHLVMDLSMIFSQPNSSLISIIEPLLYLIVLTLKNRNGNDLTELMTYLDVFEMTNNLNVREAKKMIFFHILKSPELMSKANQNSPNGSLFEAIFPTILAEIFKFIFIHQNYDKKVDAYSVVTKEIAKFVPEQKYFPSIVDFDILIENGKWKDLDLATELLTQISYMFSFDMNISDSITINSFPTISYIISLVAKFDTELFVKSVYSLLDLYPKIGYDEAYESSNIILHTINKNKIKFDKIEKLNSFVTFYTDDEDSPELQYFMFEDKFTYDMALLQSEIVMQQSSLIKTMSSKLEKILKIEDLSKLKDKEDLPLIERIFRLNNGQVLALISGAYDRIVLRQKNLDVNSHLSLSKYLSSFMRELSISGGPWTNKMPANHYKMSCYLSNSGQKVILKLNNKFDDHKKASELRDQGESTSEISILPRFKQMTASVNVNRLDGYHCQVQMISLSSFSSG